jgi:hypothetical protein
MKTLVIALLLVTATPILTHALSEWWTPANASCPSFDSEQACEAYCAVDPQNRCGGSTDCTWRTGAQRPEC